MQLDDPVPGTSELEMEPMDQEPPPPGEEAENPATGNLFGFRNPEDVEERYQIGRATPFTTEERQAAQARVDAAQLDPECQKRAIANIIRLNRNLNINRGILEDAQEADR